MNKDQIDEILNGFEHKKDELIWGWETRNGELVVILKIVRTFEKDHQPVKVVNITEFIDPVN